MRYKKLTDTEKELNLQSSDLRVKLLKSKISVLKTKELDFIDEFMQRYDVRKVTKGRGLKNWFALFLVEYKSKNKGLNPRSLSYST